MHFEKLTCVRGNQGFGNSCCLHLFLIFLCACAASYKYLRKFVPKSGIYRCVHRQYNWYLQIPISLSGFISCKLLEASTMAPAFEKRLSLRKKKPVGARLKSGSLREGFTLHLEKWGSYACSTELHYCNVMRA